MKMKYIIIVPDGMADYACEELNDMTPLEAARTTNLDFMAQHGMVGQVLTIPKGMAPGSDIGNMALLGYDPRRYHTGRAPLEAANQNIDLAGDEIAVRCNLVTVNDTGVMSDYSAGHISTGEANKLIEALNDQIQVEGVRFYPGKSYRHLVVLKTGHAKELLNLKTTPPHDILNKKINEFLPKGPAAQPLLDIMEQSRNILDQHDVNKVRADLGENPATMVWLWGQGTRPQLPSFQGTYGVKGGLISAVDLVAGIGRLAGLEIIDVPGITGYYDTNYKGKAEYAIKSLKKNDFVYIHIEAPDEAGHNGDARAKMEAIEKIDSEIIGTILNHYDKHDNIRVLVLPDHPTPVSLRTHTDEPVGFVMYGKGIAQDGTENFTEKQAEAKGLKFNSGKDLIDYFMKKYI